MIQPFIKVGILQNQESITFRLYGDFILNDRIKLTDKKITAVPNGKNILLKENGQVIYLDEKLKFVPLRSNKNIEDAKYKFEVENVLIGIDFHWEQKERESFEGIFKIYNLDGKLTLINEIEVERYLQSVISSEMNSESPFEYLKAHSIVSRSWLLAQLEARKNINEKETQFQINDNEKIVWYDKSEHEIFDVCADDHCQRYQGLTRLKSNAALDAVKETFGLVLVYDDKICDTRYSKSCGGISEEFQNVWQDVTIHILKQLEMQKIKKKNFQKQKRRFRKIY